MRLIIFMSLVASALASVAQLSERSTSKSPPKALLLGCYPYVPAVSTTLVSTIAASNMTLEACMAACVDSSYFSVRNGTECRCSKTPPTGSASLESCTTPCSGNRFEICGGASLINVYTFSAKLSAAIPATARSSKSSTIGSSTKASTTVSATPSSLAKQKSSANTINKRGVPKSAPKVTTAGCYPVSSLSSYFSLTSTLDVDDLRVEDCMVRYESHFYFVSCKSKLS